MLSISLCIQNARSQHDGVDKYVDKYVGNVRSISPARGLI